MKIKEVIKRHIEFLKHERNKMMDIQTMPGTFCHARLYLGISVWNFKIAIWATFI